MDSSVSSESRPDGISIPGITDNILKRLATPYDLIAEWSRYVSVERLLHWGFFGFAMARNEPDYTVRLFWDPGTDLRTPLPGDVVVPKNLYDRTYTYITANCHDTFIHLGTTAVFIDRIKGVSIEIDDFRNAVFQAAAEERLS